MFQSSKKSVIIIITIWILLLGLTTAATLYLNKNKSVEHEDETQIAHYNSREYYSFYNNNSLNITQEYIDKEKEYPSFQYIKISGLKNGNIENKINNEIYEYVKKRKNNKAKSSVVTVRLNAFNILSLEISTYNGEKYDRMALNYDLNTGEKIEFNDIFTNTANITSIVYAGVYDKLSTSISHKLLNISREIEAYKAFKETGIESEWSSSRSLDEMKKEEKEYQEELANVEETALGETKKILNSEDKMFYITNYGVVIFKSDEYGQDIVINAKNNMEYFGFYEKYLNNKSIYKEDKGLKNLFLSGNTNYDVVYNRVEEISDYALIDYEKCYEYNSNEISYIDQEINKYKAKFDKNKFNYLNVDSQYYPKSDKNIGAISGTLNLCTMNKDYYKNTYLKKLFDAKYENEYGINAYYNDDKDNNIKCQRYEVSTLVINDKFYDKIEDLFVKGFDYKGYLIAMHYKKKNLYYGEENMDEIKKDFEFGILSYGDIYINDKTNDVGNYFQYDTYIGIDDIPKEYLSF